MAADFFPSTNSNLFVLTQIGTEVRKEPCIGFVLVRDFDTKGAENYLIPVDITTFADQYGDGWAADLLEDFREGLVKLSPDMPVGLAAVRATIAGA